MSEPTEVSPPEPTPLAPSRRRVPWWLVRQLLLLAAVIAVVVWLVTPPYAYTASALFRVQSHRPKLVFDVVQDQDDDFQTFVQTQIMMIKSRAVLASALENFAKDRHHAESPMRGRTESLMEGKTDPVEWLSDHLSVDSQREILRVSVSDRTPEGLRELVNAVANSYVKLVVDRESMSQRMRMEELTKIYNTYQARLEKQRKALREITELEGSKSNQGLFLRSRLLRGKLTDLDRSLIRIELQATATRTRLNLKRTDKQSTKEEIARLEEDAAVREAQIKQTKEDIERIFRELQAFSHDTLSPDVLQAEVSHAEKAAQQVGDEVEKLAVELKAPPRITLIEEARSAKYGPSPR
jgi:hypothetical protein